MTPSTAKTIFKDRLPLAERYVKHLKTTGIEWGLMGPREADIMWERHVLNCAIVNELMDTDSTVIDIGSGAGLPGLTLAIARPDLQLTLVEPLERRVQWLKMVVADLKLDNVKVFRNRAEDLDIQSDYVTARAVKALKTLLPMTLPLLKSRGQLLAIKGQSAQKEIYAAKKQLKNYDAEIILLGQQLLHTPTTVVQVQHS
ncbi:MAG: 16S rRNA (guanine(527)-N(7))-methyltransferase RsmG [Micrococcaceae bacterium]